mgnify:CR=1 FL=1
MSENINVFGLKSFTDPNEAWKVMSCDFGSYEINLQILNDKTFVKAIVEQIIIRVVDYKTGRISREELEFSLGVNSEAMDTYMVNFNFFLYSQKNKKFYTSIIETQNGSCSDALTEDEKALFNELYTTYHFDDLIRRSLDFVKSKSLLFEQYENGLLEQIREAYWNEPDL